MSESKGRKFRLTKKMVNLLKKTEILFSGEKISTNYPVIKMTDCIPGEESLVISVFSSALNNEIYFKEIKK